MSVHRTHSARDGQQRPALNRPFSSNNPFRNASQDSNIGRGDAGFNNWVQRNQSQLSFSSDDEEGELFKPSRPGVGRTSSGGSGSMPPPRSTDPFVQPVSRTSTGSRHSNNGGELPTYARNTASTTDYYNTDEKSRRPSAHAQSVDLPPSYEEVARPGKSKSEYPREKQTSSTSQKQYVEEHKTRVNREWPGESNGTARQTSSRSGTHRSSRDAEHRSSRGGEHKSRRPSEPSGSTRHHSSGEHRSEKERKERREHREHKSSRSKKDKDGKPAKNVDTIDKLDVTGLFGGAFHHDGPFDACTPHRNKDQKSAPVLAFPADGPNNSIRGAAAVNKDATLRYIQGREDDDDDLYTTSVSGKGYNYARGANGSENTLAAVKNDLPITAFDATGKATPVHGETTLGLGSSTFLDGAPAARSAIQEEANKQSSGLGRKKSIRQRLQGSNYVSPPAQHVTPNMPTNERTKSAEKMNVESGGNSLLKRVKSLKVGRSRS